MNRPTERVDSQRECRLPSGLTIEALLFDYGGTLDGPASHWLLRFVDLYREAGVDVSFDRIKAAFYQADAAAYAEPRIRSASLRQLMKFHVDAQLSALDIHDVRLHTFVLDRFVERAEACLAVSRRALLRLADRFRLGVVSNFYGNVARILEDAHIAPLLSVVVDSSVVGVSKPDKRIFARAVDALGTSPDRSMHVGDSYERDVRAAHAAGLYTAWVAGPDASEPAVADVLPDARVRSLDELTDILDDRSHETRP